MAGAWWPCWWHYSFGRWRHGSGNRLKHKRAQVSHNDGLRAEIGEMAGNKYAGVGKAGEVSVVRRWSEYLVAILGGNIVYLFVEPQLPTALQHRLSKIDLGLAIDFLICVT